MGMREEVSRATADKAVVTSYVGQIHATLRTAILDGRIPNGRRFSDSFLAARFGVSRLPVRKALALLENEGLVLRRAPGTTVVTGSPRGGGDGGAEPVFPRIQPVKDRVHARLRGEIISGALAQGSRIADSAIAERYGLSRTPVREALQKLEAEGLVERDPMKGHVVSGLSDRDIAAVYSIRKALEGLAIRQAAARIAQEDLDRLQAIVESARSHWRGTAPDRLEHYMARTKEFNAILLESSREERLLSLIGHQHELLERFLIVDKILPLLSERILDDRQALIDALRARAFRRAQEIWCGQLDDSIKAYFESVGRKVPADYLEGRP